MFSFKIMSKPVITVENLSKTFTLQHQQPEGGYLAFRDVLTDKVKSLFKGKKSNDPTTEVFWALKDVSFEVNQGDRIGIIGRNGAGKSTLLKILSRIVAPTQGKITIEGRVASLLEVGTGFHPELTGRENIFLNGAILGMNKAEIKSKFDEIVDFSGVEKFLDTPVKRFSSGMYVRLAFAVAAHLEPEILIIDEVLAVGDAEFQKKCLGKMEDVSKSGRTILFVSHNMGAIQNLCSKCICLKGGQKVLEGSANEVISYYMSTIEKHESFNILERRDRNGTGVIRFKSVVIKDEYGNNQYALQCGKKNILSLEFVNMAEQKIKNLHVAIGIDDIYGQRITLLDNEVTNQIFENIDINKNIVEVVVEKLPLRSGQYFLTLFASVNDEIADWIQNACIVQVESGDFFGTGKIPPETQGNVFVNHTFSIG